MAIVTGQQHNTPALIHMLFKKQDIVEFVLHEAGLFCESFMLAVVAFRTPLAIMQKFSPAGEQGVVALFRKTNLRPWRGAGGPGCCCSV